MASREQTNERIRRILGQVLDETREDILRDVVRFDQWDKRKCALHQIDALKYVSRQMDIKLDEILGDE